MNQVKWEDLRAGEQRLLRTVAEYGMLTAPGEEETPEMIETASDLITNWQLVEKTPASLTLYPGKSYQLTDAGKAALPARLRAKFAKFDSGFRVGDFVQVDTFMGNDDLVSGQVTKVDGMYVWLDGKEEPYNVAGAIKLENVITIEDQVKAGLKPERRVGYVDVPALVGDASGDPLTEALLEGDYVGIRKLFEELKAERDAANKRRAEADAYIADLRKALEHYTDAEIVTSWGAQETQDDGAIARAALRSEVTDLGMLHQVEELKAMLGRSQNRVSYLETMTLNPADLYAQLDVQTELIEAYSEATGGLQKAKEFQSTISGLEDMCVDLVKLIEKRNRHVEYWKRIARSRIDPQILNEKVVITPADRVDYEHIRTGVISISPEAHKVERERRCKAIEASIRKCIKLDAIQFVGRIEIGYGKKDGAE